MQTRDSFMGLGDARAQAHFQDDAGNVWVCTPAGPQLVQAGDLSGALFGDLGLEEDFTFWQDIALQGLGANPADDQSGWVTATPPFITAEPMGGFGCAPMSGIEDKAAFSGLGFSPGNPAGLGLQTRDQFSGLGATTAESVIDSLSRGAGNVIQSYGDTQKNAYQGVLGMGAIGIAGTVFGSLILYRLLFGGRK